MKKLLIIVIVLFTSGALRAATLEVTSTMTPTEMYNQTPTNASIEKATATFVLAGEATPIAESAKGDQTTVLIPVKVKVKKVNGSYISVIDPELQEKIVGATYLYNNDKTYAIIMMAVKLSDQNAVKAILKDKNLDIKKKDLKELEKEFIDLKAYN